MYLALGLVTLPHPTPPPLQGSGPVPTLPGPLFSPSIAFLRQLLLGNPDSSSSSDETGGGGGAAVVGGDAGSMMPVRLLLLLGLPFLCQVLAGPLPVCCTGGRGVGSNSCKC